MSFSAVLVGVTLFTLNLAAQTYTIETIEYPGSSPTIVTGVNSTGEIVGYYQANTGPVPENFGFTYLNGTYSQIPAPETETRVGQINESGTIVGSFENGSFLFNDGHFEYFGFNALFANGINNLGTVVGITGYTQQGFLLKQGTLTMFSVPQYGNTMPYGVNDQDQVVGYAALPANISSPIVTTGFIYDQGTITTIAYPNFPYTTLTGINDLGVITGYAVDGETTVGFLYDHGTFKTFAIPGVAVTMPEGITNSGVVFGLLSKSILDSGRGFVAKPSN
ncbi:hypothetical protein [Nevskia soli]|jgi:hypothetical protein|uniref:hypothetical protein n=1 Tax=Nevskia soli TaxID=418856 RepID=UPI0015D7D8D6|nr:hypothetical protein [Nevskia soli]